MTFLCLALLFFLTVVSTHADPASRNPLTPLSAVSADDRSPDIKTEADHLANVHAGDFALYRALDFDSGVAAFQATVAGPRPGALELRLDSPTGPLLTNCPFTASGSWDHWQDITANVDHSQAGVRDVYILFCAPPGEAPSPRALVNMRSFVFLKSVATPSTGAPDLASRVDSPDENEPQGHHSWGFPDPPVHGFWGPPDSSTDGSFMARHRRSQWKDLGEMQEVQLPDSVLHNMNAGRTDGKTPLFAYLPNHYLNRTDDGGEWRTMAEGTLKAYVSPDEDSSRPGIGFASRDGKQAVYVTLNSTEKMAEVWRKLADGSLKLICQHPLTPDLRQPPVSGRGSVSDERPVYELTLLWSPYANALMVDVRGSHRSSKSEEWSVAQFRAVVDLPAARCPLLVNSGGPTIIAAPWFSYDLDAWNYRWEWYKQPVLTPDVCNPAVWRGPDGRTMYMLWRKFGADNFHGIARSDDGLHWTRVTDEAIRCTGDMTVLSDPFGDGKWYATPGGSNLPWWTSDGADDFKTWTKTNKTVGDIHGHNRIQEIIDTAKYPQLKPVHFDGQNYRFIAYCEDWVHVPQPHSVVLLSNTLTDWVQPSADPVVPPADDFWGEKGNAIGSAFPLPDGNILLAVCACTNAGYTGAPEPTNVTAIASGAEPWKILQKATLPDAPVSRENVWYQGPNFGTAFFYDDKTDTLFYYGGFHDYHIGVMRVRNFLRPK